MLANEYYIKLAQAKQKKDELMHYGIIGQKWGQRRWQYEDGRFNEEGKIRYFGKSKRESNNDEQIGSPLVAAVGIAAGLVGIETIAAIGLDAIHDAKVSRDIKKWEEHRSTEQTDPKTGLKLKSDTDASVEDDMKMINREYGYGEFINAIWDIESKKGEGSTENCMLCTTALDLKRRGYDVKAGKVKEGFYAADIKKWYTEDKIKPELGKYSDVIEKLKKEPEGSYGNFMVYWASGGGHSMFYHIENGKPVIYDAQSNKKYSLLTISLHANKVLPGTCYIRTDNLTPNYTYLKKNELIL